MIYLDNSATTKPYDAVLQSFQKVSESYYGNPSSVHSLGTDSERLLSKARQQASRLLDVRTEEVIFTSGGTEGNNTAIKGIALAHQNRGKHIITSQVEHPSVIEACRALEKIGFSVTYLPVDESGMISIEHLEAAITKETILISIMHVNNEIGTIQPVEKIGEIAKKHPKLFFHVDHVQGYGKVPLKLSGSGIDLCTISGHKVHGLKGTGLLYIKEGTHLFPLLHGGEQEMVYRSGTENVAGAVSLVKAMRMTTESYATGKDHLKSLRNSMISFLQKKENIYINTPETAAPHIINFSVPGFKPEVIIHALAEKGIFISTKSACSSKKPDESAILIACGLGKERAESALRVSLTYQNKLEEIQLFCTRFNEVIDQLSEVMG
ncbi:cysteine desulfurase family protein [Sediminibacillus massiliensis]|uniref:cysteine desulfurase family protein n=1 Tax=Sediminibacillus massiliensis TaxID=1926277 RepID=UPI00098878BB|nr:cysteine desulfurase family protein [Sediminibacillus massiliensis]